jgi:hypothetical protein
VHPPPPPPTPPTHTSPRPTPVPKLDHAALLHPARPLLCATHHHPVAPLPHLSNHTAPRLPLPQKLTAICERLVTGRLAQDDQRLDQLYVASLAQISDGGVDSAALALADPQQYSVQLAEAVSGEQVVKRGYGPAFDAVLAAAPPAAMTPEGIKQGHELVGGWCRRAGRRQAVAACMLQWARWHCWLQRD